MPKLIELYQEDLIICDTPNCDYKVKNETGDPSTSTTEYINKPCPICGANLLTQEDNDNAVKFVKRLNWINKYLGWLSFFTGTKYVGGKSNQHHTSIHFHDGITIESKN